MSFDPLQNKIGSLSIEELIEQASQQEQKTEQADGSGRRFDDVLGRLVHDVDSLQKTAETTIQDLADETKAGPDEVSRKMKDADAAYNLMMQIRHKLVDVYSAVEHRKDQV